MSTIERLVDHALQNPNATIAKGVAYIRQQRPHLRTLREGTGRHAAVEAAIGKATTTIFQAARAEPDLVHYRPPIALPARLPQRNGCFAAIAGSR